MRLRAPQVILVRLMAVALVQLVQTDSILPLVLLLVLLVKLVTIALHLLKKLPVLMELIPLVVLLPVLNVQLEVNVPPSLPPLWLVVLVNILHLAPWVALIAQRVTSVQTLMSLQSDVLTVIIKKTPDKPIVMSALLEVIVMIKLPPQLAVEVLNTLRLDGPPVRFAPLVMTVLDKLLLLPVLPESTPLRVLWLVLLAPQVPSVVQMPILKRIVWLVPTVEAPMSIVTLALPVQVVLPLLLPPVLALILV